MAEYRVKKLQSDSFQILIFLLILISLVFIDIKIFNTNISTYLTLFAILISFNSNISTYSILFLKKRLLLLLLFYITGITILIINNTGVTIVFKYLSYLLYLIYSITLFNLYKSNINIFKLIFAFTFFSYCLTYIFIHNSITENSGVYNFTHITTQGLFITYLFLVIIQFNWSRKVNYIIILTFFIFLIINTARGAIIISICYLLIYNYNKGLKSVIYTLILLLLSISLLFILKPELFTFLTFRFQGIYDLNKESSTGYRLSVFLDGLNHLINYPFGTGYNSFDKYFFQESRLNLYNVSNLPIDNSYIKISYDMGIIPLFFFIAFIIKNFTTKNPIALAISLTIIISFFLDVLYENGLFILLSSFLYVQLEINNIKNL